MVDYHTHSAFSPDSDTPLRALAEADLRAGLREVAVTDHCDMGAPFDMDAYAAALRALRRQMSGRLNVRLGVELGEPTHDLPRAARELAGQPLDFVIGSYHMLRDRPDFYYMDCETLTPEDCHILIRQYLTEVLEHCRTADFDVLGHLTYPLRYMHARNPALRGVDFSAYEEPLRVIFAALVERGRGIELNVSGLRKNPPMLMPDLPILRLYRACGGRIVTVGSDAHRAEDVGSGIAEGLETLRAAGFTHVALYQERRPIFEPIV